MNIVDFLTEGLGPDFLYVYDRQGKLMAFQVIKKQAQSVVIRQVSTGGKTKKSSKVVPKKGAWSSAKPVTARLKGGKPVHPAFGALQKWPSGGKKPMAPMKESLDEARKGFTPASRAKKVKVKVGGFAKGAHVPTVSGLQRKHKELRVANLMDTSVELIGPEDVVKQAKAALEKLKEESPVDAMVTSIRQRLSKRAGAAEVPEGNPFAARRMSDALLVEDLILAAAKR